MATQLQIRRGSDSQVSAFTGAEGEIVVNTTNDSIHVNDGSTAGGFELARADLNNVSDTDLNAALTGNTVSALTVTSLTSSGIDVTGTVTADGLTVDGTTLFLDGTFTTGSTPTITLGDSSTYFKVPYGSNAAIGGYTGIDIFGTASGNKIATFANGGDISFYEDTGTTPKLFWDASAESLGIGTSSPGATYHLLSGSAAASIHATTNASTGYHEYRYNTSTTAGFLGNGSGLLSGAAASDFILRSEGALVFNTNGNNRRVTIDTSGNVGIGCTPDAWSGYSVLQIGTAGCLAATEDTTFVGANAYSSATGWKYVTTDEASLYQQESGNHVWYGAASGSADAAVSWSERARIDSSGNLLVNRTAVFTTAKMEIQSDAGDASTLALNSIDTDGSILEFYKAGSPVGSIGADVGTIKIDGGSTAAGILSWGGTRRFRWIDSFYPDVDNQYDLGLSVRRFDDIFATNGTIQTSDRNEKQDIEALSDAEQRVAVAAKGLLRKFRWIDRVEEKGDEARIHFGIIAQDLQDAFTAEGLDAGRYAMFINSTWTDEETGEERSRMGVRYSELLAFIISAI